MGTIWVAFYLEFFIPYDVSTRNVGNGVVLLVAGYSSQLRKVCSFHLTCLTKIHHKSPTRYFTN